MIMKPFVFLIIMWRAYITESCTIGDVTSKSCPAGWENLIVRCCESPRSGCACVDIVCTCALVWESYTRTCQDPTCPTDYTDIGVACVCDPVSTLTTLTNQINDARNILSNCAPTLLQVISNFVEPDASDIPAFLAYAHDSMIAFDDCIGTHITRRRMLFNNEYVMALEIGLGVSQIVSEFGAVLGYILIAPNQADRGRFYISEYSGITFDVGMKAFVSLQFYTSLGNIEGTGNYGSFSGSSDIQFGYTLVPPEFTSAGMSWSVSVGGIPSIEYTASIGTTSFNRWLANDEVSQALAQGDNFQWSSAGAIGGQICVQWHEGSDPHTWHDNYLCSKKDHGIAWSSAGSINGMRCTQIHEAADTEGTWHDNFLCVPPNSNLIFQWSSAGSMPAPAKCVQIHEGAEPGHTTWHDNYLCYYWTGNVGEEASGKSLNINCDDDSASHRTTM